MTEKRSGAQIGAANLQKLIDWIETRYRASDWDDYIRSGKLNKSEIAAECGFARSVFAQNPALKSTLEALEKELHGKGILDAIKAAQYTTKVVAEDLTSDSLNSRTMADKAKAEARVKSLEELNAALKAEVHDLREQLTRFKHLDDNLMKTGRLLHP